MRNNKIITIIGLVMLLVASSCGCSEDDSGDNETLPECIELSPVELKGNYEGETKTYTGTVAEFDFVNHYSQGIFINQDFFLGEPRSIQGWGSFKLLNNSTRNLRDIRLTIETPSKWTHEIQYGLIETLAANESIDVLFLFDTNKAPRFLGFDFDGDGFADVFKPINNELNVDCEREGYPKIYSDGLEPGDYTVRIKAWAPGVKEFVLNYSIIIYERVDI